MRGHVLSIIQVILLPACCVVTYVWSVLLGHVEAGFPYISDTGTYPPESCVFGLLLDVYATLSVLMVYIRWQQVKTYYLTDESRVLHNCNNVSLVMGLIAAFGVLLVANFQETNVIVVHLLGAFLAFVVGAAYMWVQTYLSYRTCLPGHRRCLRHFRLLLSLVGSVFVVFVPVFSQMASHKFNKNGEAKDFKLKWFPSEEGFIEHVISAALEWVLAFISSSFFATFTLEFRHFTVTLPIEFTLESAVVSSDDDKGVANVHGLAEGEFNSTCDLVTSDVTSTTVSGGYGTVGD